jgi:hypothetical protein
MSKVAFAVFIPKEGGMQHAKKTIKIFKRESFIMQMYILIMNMCMVKLRVKKE